MVPGLGPGLRGGSCWPELGQQGRGTVGSPGTKLSVQGPGDRGALLRMGTADGDALAGREEGAPVQSMSQEGESTTFSSWVRFWAEVLH